MEISAILVSVIVPIYNVENYLYKCIESIQRQTHNNIEIILVDDGSTDGSGKICDEIAQKDKRIKVIHRENGGVTSARKAGVYASKGSYIGFVDGDDWIEANMYEVLLKEAVENASQVVHCNMYRHKFTGEITSWKSDMPEGIYNMDGPEGEYIIKNLFSGINSFNNGVSGGLHVKLFERELLETYIGYVSDKISGFAEDKVIVYSVVLHAKTIQIVNKELYHGIDRKGSYTHSVVVNFFEQIQLIYDYFKTIFENHPFRECLMHQLHQFVLRSALANINALAGKTMIPEFYPSNREQIQGKNIVLYGAGKVGRSYHMVLKADKISNIVLWIDVQANLDKGIFPVEDIANADYDYVVVAIAEKMMYQSMYEKLISLNVKREKILWIKPLYLTEHYMTS